jgi:hypothetical protein
MTEPVYYEDVKHSDIIRLILAASRDEGESSLLVRFGGRDYLIAVRLVPKPEATPDVLPEEAADTPEPLRMDDIVTRLAELGIHSFIEHTGGGVATLYAGYPLLGPNPGDVPRYPAMAGPGYFVQLRRPPAPEDALADPGEFWVGADDDGSTAPTRCSSVPEAVSFIQVLVAQAIVDDDGR